MSEGKDRRKRVVLDAYELQFLAMTAERRNCVKDPHQVPDRKCDERMSDFGAHLHGVMGEYAVARLLGVKVDKSVSLSGDDKVSDLVVNGHTVQVKTALGPGYPRHLFFNSYDLFKADVAVLAVIEMANVVSVAGWVTRDHFEEHAGEIDFGYGKRIGICEEFLRAPDDLQPFLSEATHVEG